MNLTSASFKIKGIFYRQIFLPSTSFSKFYCLNTFRWKQLFYSGTFRESRCKQFIRQKHQNVETCSLRRFTDFPAQLFTNEQEANQNSHSPIDQQKLLTKTESAAKAVEESKRTKLQDLEDCLGFIEASTQNGGSGSGMLEECRVLVDKYRQFILMHRKDQEKYKGLYLRVLFSILHVFKQHKGEQEAAPVDRINTALDKISYITTLKRHCLVGSLLLADNQLLEFFDYLKREKLTLQSHHIDGICRVAHAARNAKILEPIVEMPDYIPQGPTPMAKLYETLALLYGKQGRQDKLEWLWRLILRRRSREDQKLSYKPALHRIAQIGRASCRERVSQLV